LRGGRRGNGRERGGGRKGETAHQRFLPVGSGTPGNNGARRAELARISARDAGESKAVEPARPSRLAPDARRDQLIQKGLELLGRQAADDMSITELSQAAGISKGLLYHYFPTKSDFVVAVFRKAREELEGRMVLADPSLDPAERLDASLDAFLVYVEEHAAGFLAIARARTVGDEAIRAELAEGRRRRVDQLVAVAAARAGREHAAADSPMLRAALEGWLSYSETVIVRWLSDRQLERSDVRRLLRQTFIAALDSVAEPAL
jgi:AcrR family transcriptional regulator